jgi:hypothetical protein
MFGSHLSITNGMHDTLLEAERLDMEIVQVFTNSWPITACMLNKIFRGPT